MSLSCSKAGTANKEMSGSVIKQVPWSIPSPALFVFPQTDLSVARGALKFSKELGWDKYTPAVRLDHIQENEYLED